MNSLVLDRIKAQQENNTAPKQEIVFTKFIPTPVSPEELQLELSKLFDVETTIKIEEKPIQDFPDLFHFVEWYLGKENLFTEKQNMALKTLVEARDLINIGCACKRQQRLQAAQNYFQIFWTNNLKTDLLPTVLKICQTDKIKFGDFLIYP